VGRDLRIVDCHVHLWDLSRARYGWLQDDPLPNNPAGDMSPIAHRDYLLKDYLADTANWRVDKIVHVEAGQPRGAQLAETDWRAGFGKLARHGLSFDLQLYPSQMAEAVELADAHPDIPLIINHAGLPTDRDEAGMAVWRAGLKALAERPQVSIKISGLGITDRAWTPDSIRPVVLECIDIFGARRAMFASDFPVERVHGAFDAFYSAFDAITADFTAEERDRLFAANAEAIYRI